MANRKVVARVNIDGGNIYLHLNKTLSRVFGKGQFFCLEWHMPGDLGDGHQQNLFQDIPPIASNDDIYLVNLAHFVT